ncbi:bifunctional UDP-sugar hydrolase/5'-nucleotidase [Flectobacillus sp. BAB-3569]|uniref:bifunctional metallophosphatase/5'-nucleotidase n=1 Tax=Flectobacillus sp. BAB-3569 TaxID=1509483 RepID=UPI00159636B7|nr:bifunctional metallophosphatase/5'-nucleotidase [Flectobacillus sp. BAB-3569]
MKKLVLLLLVFQALFISCKSGQTPNASSSSTVNVTFLHLNDVYEIAPLEGGKVGGMARVATVRKELLAQNPNTITLLAGDFLNPSLIGTFKHEGKSIKGKQMVEVMDAIGMDWVGLGNHEFDVDEAELVERINLSKFNWLASNAFHNAPNGVEPFTKNGVPFPKTTVLTFKNASGASVKVGMFSVVLPANKKNFVVYDDFFESAKKAYQELKPQCDFVVAITHLNKVDDAKLAEMLPEVKLLMGGHDHDNMIQKVGDVVIAKADANAKTVYVHNLSFDTKTKKVSLTSELRKIDDTIAEDASVATIVQKWEQILNAAIKKMGLDKNDVVATLDTPLDGRESSIRNFQTNLGTAIAKAMSKASSQPNDCAIFNGGSVRIDDQVGGKVTQLDIMRVLPFGGKIVEAEMKGRLLEQVLNTGLKNKGNGGYLQWDKITYNNAKNEWTINGKLLDVNQTYYVVLPKFLIEGKETNLGFLTDKNPDVLKIIEPDANDTNDVRSDVRKVLIAYLKTK